jgi:hypothetical protein
LALAGTDFAPRVALAALLQWIQGVSFISTMYKTKRDSEENLQVCREMSNPCCQRGGVATTTTTSILHPPAAVAGVLLRVQETFEINQLKIRPFTTSTGFLRIWPVANLLPLF